ncbi:hypothetical protein RHSIM_Rhsim01G0149200 [Rhododendron simsii]|uniref:Uncharacterized protein n=1 Tax=Rhododendron simsii TaxID=118357 RepID=A0A834HJL7_RHOSS|nr:hypothetical protein RHSIM_Rhsim01G0149200 [Rhododendron simsii]
MLKRLEKKLRKGALMEAAQACKNTESLHRVFYSANYWNFGNIPLLNARKVPIVFQTIVANKIRNREWTLATIAFLLDPVDPLFCKALFPVGSLANYPRDNYDQMLAAGTVTCRNSTISLGKVCSASLEY